MNNILILTNKDDITVDFIIRELKKRGMNYYRLNTEDIPQDIKVKFDINNEKFKIFDCNKELEIDLLSFNSVYFRRPLINNLNYLENVEKEEKEYLKKELIFILEGIYKILENKYWLNNVYDIREAENKVYQLNLAKEIGFSIPKALISNSIEMFEEIKNEKKATFIIKPIKSGSLSENKVIFTTKLSKEILNNKERIEAFPIFIESNIHKRVDLRCTVIGEDVFTAEIHSQENADSKVDWRKGENLLEHKEHKLPKEIEELCVKLTRKLKLNYSAIDMILDENNNYIFLEINPNGQWAWIENRLNFPISEKIADLLLMGGK